MPATASVSVRTLFAPFDDTQGEFLSFIAATKRSLYIVIYGFHLPKLTDLLIQLHQSGVIVGVILDHSQEEGKAEQPEVQRLVDAGVPVLIGTSPVHRQILHSKFSVRDGEAVEFGSWNYSLSASQQSNTMSVITDAGYARDFLTHYDRVRSFILLHEMAMQIAGEAIAPAALPADDSDPAPAPAAPLSTSSSQGAGSDAPSASAASERVPSSVSTARSRRRASRRQPAPAAGLAAVARAEAGAGAGAEQGAA